MFLTSLVISFIPSNIIWLRSVIIVALLMIFYFLGNILLENIVLTPVRLFIYFSQKISEKDLSQRLDIRTNDEFMVLANSLNEMVNNLRSILDENLEAAEQLAVAASEMASMAEKANKGTEAINTTMESMAKVTEEQFENVDLSVLASQQMSETAQQVASEAQKAASFSSQAAQRAKGGEEIIQDINTKILQLKETVDSSAETVRRLGDRSLEIGKIVDVMRGIARQTNLLALNAAIEAARAGEHGRGFSVVADEVRALAEQSTNSAVQIVAMINEIQNETKSAVEAMEIGTRVVDESTSLANFVKSAFSEITGTVIQTVNTIHEIAAASQEQAASSEEMTSTMQIVSSVSKQNVTNAKQVAASTVGQQMTMENLAISAAQLVQMADHLTSMVGRFKVKADFQRCWRVLDCNWVNCPAYQATEEKCWLIHDTLCQDGIPNGSVTDKRQICHQCEVFKINTRQDIES
jgi:methyl-accepting chemotaxis protein